MIQLPSLRHSSPRSSFWITQAKFERATAQQYPSTVRRCHASSKRFLPKLTEKLARMLKPTPTTPRLGMLLALECVPPSQFASKHSLRIHHLAASPFEITA